MIWPSHASSFGSCCLNGVTFKTHNSQGAWDISCEVSLQSEQKQVRRSRCTAVSSSTLTCHVWLPKGMAKNIPFNEQREVAPERLAYIIRTRVPHQRMWDKSKATKTAETVPIYIPNSMISRASQPHCKTSWGAFREPRAISTNTQSLLVLMPTAMDHDRINSFVPCTIQLQYQLHPQNIPFTSKQAASQ